MFAKWMLAPSGYYIGLLVVDNCHIYASGRTSDMLEKRMKKAAYIQKRISQRQVWLEQNPSEEIDLQYASAIFKSKYCKARDGQPKVTVTSKKMVTEPKPIFEHITEIDKDTGELIVYKLIEVSRFKLRNRNDHKELVTEWREQELRTQPYSPSVDIQPFRQPMKYTSDCEPVAMVNKIDAE